MEKTGFGLSEAIYLSDRGMPPSKGPYTPPLLLPAACWPVLGVVAFFLMSAAVGRRLSFRPLLVALACQACVGLSRLLVGFSLVVTREAPEAACRFRRALAAYAC